MVSGQVQEWGRGRVQERGQNPVYGSREGRLGQVVLGEVDPARLTTITYNTGSIRSYQVNLLPHLPLLDLGQGRVQRIPQLEPKNSESGFGQVQAAGEGIWGHV